MCTASVEGERCQVCGNGMQAAFRATVLQKYPVEYYRCAACGFVRTQSPYWLEESYSEAIAATDVGLVQRNINNTRLLEPVITRLFGEDAVCIDVGGGYGLLTRMLRDIGFDCYTWDKYCDNIFAKAFEAEGGRQADLLLAFEVMEHLEDPAAFVADKMAEHGCRSLVFSTQLYSGDMPERDWWYLSLETGQHISLFGKRTLLTLAENLGLSYYRIKGDTHLLTDRRLGRVDQALLFKKPWSRWYRQYVRRQRRHNCRIPQDYERIKSTIIGMSDAVGTQADGGRSDREANRR